MYFLKQPFYGNYSTLDSRTNTVISHGVWLLVKRASKAVTRSIVEIIVSLLSLELLSQVILLLLDCYFLLLLVRVVDQRKSFIFL